MRPNAKGKTIMDYLPMAAQRLIGKAQPEVVAEQSSVTEQSQVIDKVKPQFLTPLLQYLLTDLVFRFVCHFLSICKKQGRNFASLAY
jgi:hypothetical protein